MNQLSDPGEYLYHQISTNIHPTDSIPNGCENRYCASINIELCMDQPIIRGCDLPPYNIIEHECDISSYYINNDPHHNTKYSENGEVIKESHCAFDSSETICIGYRLIGRIIDTYILVDNLKLSVQIDNQGTYIFENPLPCDVDIYIGVEFVETAKITFLYGKFEYPYFINGKVPYTTRECKKYMVTSSIYEFGIDPVES
jgi:hypothetical protein